MADDGGPHALLAAHDAEGVALALAQVRVAAGFKLNAASVPRAWTDGGLRKPG